MKMIDCRGLACPAPVVETKKALEEPGVAELVVLLDDTAARENVARFATSQGWRVSVTPGEGGDQIRIQKKDGPAPETEKESGPASREGVAAHSVVFIDTDVLGRGPEELGKILMRSFLQTLEQSEFLPQKILLLNNGVKLACEGSEVLEDLQEFSLKGVEILACGTCLDFFRLKKKLQAGRVSNMYEILTSLEQAGKVIKI